MQTDSGMIKNVQIFITIQQLVAAATIKKERLAQLLVKNFKGFTVFVRMFSFSSQTSRFTLVFFAIIKYQSIFLDQV